MPQSILDIKERLEKVINKNGTVQDMAVAAEAISLLEKISVTKEELEKTRLGRYVNIVRKAAKDNPPLAKRARNLVKAWQQMISLGTPQRQPLTQQRLRPETPNSVGSSPSPPEPYTPPNSSQILTPSTPYSGGGSKRSKKSSKEAPKSSKSAKKSSKSPDTTNGSHGVEGKGSEVKKSPEGQHLMSVGTNGLKLTFKMTPAEANEDEEVDVVVSDGNHQWRKEMLKQTDQSKRADTPTQEDGRKKHKKKKQHKSSHRTEPLPPAAPNFSSERLSRPSQEDLYNNNKNQSKIHPSQSTPNLTVTKPKIRSPEKTPKNHLSTPKSCNDLQKLSTDNANASLKRKRDPSLVNDSSPDSMSPSRSDRPRGTKERRLTFDPVTNQLQERQSSDNHDQTSTKITKKSPEKVQTVKTEPSTVNSAPNKTPLLKKEKVLEKIKIEPKKTKIPQETAAEITNDAQIVDGEEMPTGLVPSVSILSDYGKNAVTCSGQCTNNFHEMRRQFRKRKTRRKDDIIDLPSLFPISNLVTMVSSDSEGTSDADDAQGARGPQDTFCSSLALESRANLQQSTDPSAASPAGHSAVCEWSGVNGCRGNNGGWYDWIETFCVQNHEKKNALPLPNEEEIMPLHILPYVELD